MSIFESGVRDGRRAAGARFVSGTADAGSRAERFSTAHLARQPELGRSATAQLLMAVGRLVFPVLLLVTAVTAALIYGNEPVAWLGNSGVGGKPFDTDVLALPAALFVVQLTNRRYGASYAFLQLIGAIAAVIAVALYAGDDLTLLRGTALPPPRILAGFGAGLFAAELVAIFIFDRMRGPRWWQAPLFASLLGGVILAVTAFPIAYSGTGVDWFEPMLAYAGLMAAAAVALLLPYWLLRPVISPLSGFGGY